MLDMIADYQAGKREERRLSATTVALLSFRRTSITKPIPPVNSATTDEDDSAETITTNNLAPNPFMIATKPKMEKCIATVATNPAGRPVRRQRRQIRELNDCISCCLCNGYLVNATSVDICEHSFCRSCIITYLDSDNNCPQCKPQNRYINLSNLRSDDILRSLVYKLVPGLIQQERERQLQFWKSLDSTSECDMPVMEEEYIYPAEPISLSLEYHPALLVSCNKSQIPPVRYLQCPAGVTVHHLKRFLCSKYDIDPANQLVDIDIMYEEEILPEDFSLVDVGYCYNWKRVAPMRFSYRILVHNSPPVSSPAIRSAEMLTTPPDMRVLGESNLKEAAEAKLVKKSTNSDVMAAPAVKTVRFLEPPTKADKHGEVNRQVTYSVFKSNSMDLKDSSSNQYSNHNNNNNNNEKEREKNEGNGTMKMIIARKQSPKRSSSDESIYNITNDFKSLRSNDMRYSDYTVTSTTSGGTTTLTKKSKEDSKPLVTKCDIVVSIPQSQFSRSPNSSDESTENISLAALKTANKKSSPSSSSTPKKNVPKLKIELNSLKTKITIPKPKSAEIRQEPRKVSKRKLSIDERPGFDRVDLKTYAKNIGLKPIEMEKSPGPLDVVAKTKVSPDASPMSTASSTGSSTSNGTFSFTANDGCSSSSSSHKKRKKKHSKEPKDSNGKRRKLHAEISSQTADESLKMKVKITGSHNHRPHKVEARKSSSSSDDVVVTTPTTTKLPPPAAASLKPTLNGTDQRKSPKQAPSPPAPAPQPPGQIAGAAQNNMPMLNRPIAKEPSKTSGEVDRRESEHSKKPTESKPKPSSTQIMTTVHARVPSTTQTTSTSTSTCASTSPSTATTTSCSKSSLPKPLANIQEMKIPASPPLPPSLFKTTPLTIPSITPTTTKPTAPPPKPQRTNFANQPNRPPKLAPAPAPPAKTQFAVPQAPPKATPNTSKITPISSIASSAHKHAAQLKRSASVDGPHPTGLLTKQQKMDQDRMIRKSAYGPMSQHEPQRHPKTSTSSGNTSTSTSSKSSSKPYYSSSMSSSYTQEMSKRKPPPMLMPPSSISVTKAPHSSSSTNATIGAPQQKKLYPHQHSQKPSVEIVRVPPSPQPMEHKPTPIKSSPPKATRPPPPPIPLVKIKKPVNQPIPTRSPALTVSTKTTSGHSQPSPPGLISMRSIIPAIVASKSAATIAENAPKQPEKSSPETNGKPPKEKSSSSACKERRPSSRDGSVEILDLSSGKQTKSPATPSTPTSAGNSLEAALNKIKQNITSSTVPDSIAAANNKSSKADNSPDDLQNLHLLSESATNREKIAIKTLPKLNEISKVRSGQAPVRQQNASVRNIPNPSALAFRNLPQPPMLNSTTSNAAAPPSPPVGASKPEFKIPTPPNGSPSSSTNPGSPPRLKKNLNIEQVAANLNMRAAAAADKSEALSTTGVTVAASVSSTSHKEPKPAVVTSSNVVSSSSSSSSSLSLTSSTTSMSSTTAKISREPSVTPTPPKTSFKSISSLVASSSPSSKTVSAGSA